MDSKFLKKMYGKQSDKSESLSNKNPNRVTGGLRAQGSDSLMMLGEDGQEREIPSKKYVETLEENLKKQQQTIQHLQETINRLERSQRDLENNVQGMYQQLKDR